MSSTVVEHWTADDNHRSCVHSGRARGRHRANAAVRTIRTAELVTTFAASLFPRSARALNCLLHECQRRIIWALAEAIGSV